MLWTVKDASAYHFSVDAPDNALKAVAESTMREVIGQSTFDAINPNREVIASRVRRLMQTKLDLYGAGVEITSVQLGKVSAPDQVGKAYRDVQAAQTSQEGMRSDAEAYANRVIPEARGQAAQIVQQAEAYRQQAIAEASGEAKRFLAIYPEYRKAPEVTRKRMYLETMSKVLAPMNKVIRRRPCGAGRHFQPASARRAEKPHGNGDRHPRCHGDERQNPEPAADHRGAAAMNRLALALAAAATLVLVVIVYMSVYTINPTEQAILLQWGAPRAVETEPGLHVKIPSVQTVAFIDKRLLNVEVTSEQVLSQDGKQLFIDAYAYWRIADPIRFNEIAKTKDIAGQRLIAILDSNLRSVLGAVSMTDVLSAKREQLMRVVRADMNQETKEYGIEIVDVGLRHVNLPQESSDAVFVRMQQEREREATQFRAEGSKLPSASARARTVK